MLGNVPGVTRELLTSLLASYASKSMPSAMANILADALAIAADRQACEMDAECVRTFVERLRTYVTIQRACEDYLYLGDEAEKVG